MDNAQLLAASRYVENNPVAARLVERPDQWAWSSARSHLAGQRHPHDRLTDRAALTAHLGSRRAYRHRGANLADAVPEAEEIGESID